MKESQTLKEEAKRIHWRLEILQGKHGEKAYKRLLAMVTHNFPERFCV